MKCYRKIPQKEPITKKGLLAVALSTAIIGAAIAAPISYNEVNAEALPDVAGAAATTVGQYLYSIFAASGNSLANHEVNTAMMTELSITMQDLAEEGIITLRGQVYDPNDQEQINEVIQAFGQRTGDVEVNVAQFAQRIQALDTVQTARLEQAAFSLDKLETDPNLSYPDYFVYFSYALQGYLEAGMIEGAKLYEIAMNASDNVIIALDDIHDSIIEFFSPNIRSGVDIRVDPSIFGNYARSQFIMTQFGNNQYQVSRTFSADGGFFVVSDNSVNVWLVNNTDSKINYGQNNMNGNTFYGVSSLTNSVNSNSYSLIGSNYGNRYISYCQPNVLRFGTTQQAVDYISGVLNKTIDPPVMHSPDIVNQNNGNLSENNMENTAPAINASEGLLPIPTADIAPFEQAVADNNAQQLYPDNADEAELLINPYIVPNTAPAPDPEPEYNPIPDQPTIPEKDPITSEQEQTNLGGATQGLEDIFPFCIPFDIGKVFTAFTANRKAPYIKCPIDPWGDYIELDFSVFDEAAALLRLLELILFIVGLALAARSLIGAGG